MAFYLCVKDDKHDEVRSARDLLFLSCLCVAMKQNEIFFLQYYCYMFIACISIYQCDVIMGCTIVQKDVYESPNVNMYHYSQMK